MGNRAQTHEVYIRIRDYLINAINENRYGPGDRMPTERHLAEQFKVSRAITRRALADLEAKGLILRRVGRGTFVRPLPDSVPTVLGLDGAVSPAEYIELRLRFEPELSWLIATHATKADFERMEDCLKHGKKALPPEEFEIWDGAFHLALADATHNKLVKHVYNLIHSVRHGQAVWGALLRRGQKPGEHKIWQREHQEIFDALKRRDAEQAREFMSKHIRATRRRLLDY